MSIAFRAASTGDTGGAAATSMTAVIPASVQAGDVILVFATCTFHGPNLAISSTATTPALIFDDNTQPFFNAGYALWWIVAGASDAGATLTVTSTSAFMGMTVAAYSGCDNITQPDVYTPGDTGSTAQFSWTAPSATTGAANDWEVDFAALLTGGASISAHPGTLRVQGVSFPLAATDSNGSVGAAGTGIGGGTWTSPVSTVWNGFTVGLKAAAGGPVTEPAATGAVIRGRKARRGASSGSPAPLLHLEDVPVAAAGAAVRGRSARKGAASGSPQPRVRIEELPATTGASVRGRPGRKGRAAGSQPIPVIVPPLPPAATGKTVTGRRGRRGSAQGSPAAVVAAFVQPQQGTVTISNTPAGTVTIVNTI